ncbi:MarR family winged helix-turn-helix transcriptional regulator [Streptomyces sp. NPDC057291]|uniref:MarR family winged helix-turn-helix transcriptional regulator n=1 Tax=Streptomyces sp. NPDC057291 TaxID=3346087 RepID=UPI00362973C1
MAFDTDSASMTRTVQRRERAGFVRRWPDPDGRATLVETTLAGTALRRQVEKFWAGLEDVTTGDMTQDARRVLLHGLERVEDNLAAGTDPASAD